MSPTCNVIVYDVTQKFDLYGLRRLYSSHDKRQGRRGEGKKRGRFCEVKRRGHHRRRPSAQRNVPITGTAGKIWSAHGGRAHPEGPSAASMHACCVPEGPDGVRAACSCIRSLTRAHYPRHWFVPCPNAQRPFQLSASPTGCSVRQSAEIRDRAESGAESGAQIGTEIGTKIDHANSVRHDRARRPVRQRSRALKLTRPVWPGSSAGSKVQRMCVYSAAAATRSPSSSTTTRASGMPKTSPPSAE